MKPIHLTICLIIISLFLILPSNRPTPSPSETGKKKESHGTSIQKKTNDKNEKPKLRMLSDQIITINPLTPTPKSSNQRNNKTSQQQEPPPTDWITRFTAILAIVASLQFIALIIQYFDIRRERRISERAWILPSINQEFTPGEKEIRFFIDNTGKTPAFIKNIIITGFGEFTNQLTPIPRGKIPTLMTVFPNERIMHKEPIRNSNQVSTQQEISLWGIIVYDDIFGKRKWTRFHRVYNEESKMFIIEPNIREGYNDAK